jgi:hypothetical protein
VARTDSGVWVDLSELRQSLGMFGSSLAGSWARRAQLGPCWRPGWVRLNSVAPRSGPVEPAVMQWQRPAWAATCRFVAVCKSLAAGCSGWTGTGGRWKPVVGTPEHRFGHTFRRRRRSHTPCNRANLTPAEKVKSHGVDCASATRV